MRFSEAIRFLPCQVTSRKYALWCPFAFDERVERGISVEYGMIETEDHGMQLAKGAALPEAMQSYTTKTRGDPLSCS